MKKPEGWDEYHETHYPLILTDQGGGVLWVPNGVEVTQFSIPHKTFEEELREALSAPIEDD